MENQNYPLIVVFYLDKGVFEDQETINRISETIERTFEIKETKAITFLLPSDGEPRIECINPVQVSETDMGKIMGILEDVKKENTIKR